MITKWLSHWIAHMACPRIDFGLQIFLVIVAIPFLHHHEFYLPGSSLVLGGKSAWTDGSERKARNRSRIAEQTLPNVQTERKSTVHQERMRVRGII